MIFAALTLASHMCEARVRAPARFPEVRSGFWGRHDELAGRFALEFNGGPNAAGYAKWSRIGARHEDHDSAAYCRGAGGTATVSNADRRAAAKIQRLPGRNHESHHLIGNDTELHQPQLPARHKRVGHPRRGEPYRFGFGFAR